jgi:PPOX class probable FMN-dependent enzyme
MAAVDRDLGFERVVGSVEELDGVYGPPDEAVKQKAIDHLDEHCREFIARSPFVLIATADRDGRCDVSPKGGPPGFVEVCDEKRLVIPDAKGNRRLDSFRNVVDRGRVGLLFLIPGLDETLRVNGRACLFRDPDVLERHATQGKIPGLALGVGVEEAFLHCAKAFRRSSLWQPEAWPSLEGLARPAQIWRDHIALPDLTTEAIEEYVEDDYRRNLY